MTVGSTLKPSNGPMTLKGIVPRALTVAGSDSGGGAGIQADLKTFAALRVYGMSAITAITAQNTVNVIAVHDVPTDVIRAQIEAVFSDIGVDAAKTGMLHTSEIIRVVADKIEEYKIPTVVDPVMISKSGAELLQESAIDALRKTLLPVATVVTPNAKEAEALAQIKIRTLKDAKEAAKSISGLGPRAVVVKGGHIPFEKQAVDTLYFEGDFKEFSAPFVESVTDHGTGCSFSAAITAELAKANTIPKAVEVAKGLITTAIRHGILVGKGHGPVNPISIIYRDAERWEVLEDMKQAIQKLEESELFFRLIPESQCNIAMSLRDPESLLDVAAVPGRIVKVGHRAKASNAPWFGASKHVASAILTATRFDPSIRAALNILYLPSLISISEKLGLKVSYYDRTQEPEDIRNKEGASVPWGTEQAILRIQKVPDMLYHKGGYGKEPMAVIFGTSAQTVAERALRIADQLDR